MNDDKNEKYIQVRNYMTLWGVLIAILFFSTFVPFTLSLPKSPPLTDHPDTAVNRFFAGIPYFFSFGLLFLIGSALISTVLTLVVYAISRLIKISTES